MKTPIWMLIGLMAVAGCTESQPEPSRTNLAEVRVSPQAPTLKRLTRTQYQNSVWDLIDDEVVLAGSLEPDESVHGLLAVGASRTTISPLGVERYEASALRVARQVAESEERVSRLITCDRDSMTDEACLEQFVEEFGLRAWRRPLEPDEVQTLTDVGVHAATASGGFEFTSGVEYIVAALLQSPNFLFRVEVGEPDPEDSNGYRYTDYEMATRLSYYLANTTPDAEMLAAAEAGVLTTEAGIREQANRLLESPAGRRAVRNFFSDLYLLNELDSLTKDTSVFIHMSSDLGESAREETLRLIEHIVFERDTDFRTLFTTSQTFVDRRLANLYEIPAPDPDGFGMVTLPSDSGRRGFLGHASFLAGQSHPVGTSAVLRGIFVRTVLLCGEIPPPPAELNTGLPEPDASSPTLRDRSMRHQEDPVCASCHANMDPIGLGLENFDGIGRHRTTENEALIDPSGDLDGVYFADAWELGEAVAKHPQFGQCLARNAYRYATGNVEDVGEVRFIQALGASFAESGYRVKSLLLDIATSPAFRKVSEGES